MKAKLSSLYIIIIITSTILLGLAIFVIRPKVNNIISLYKQKQEKEIELVQAKQKEKDLEKLEDDYKDITEQLSKVYQALPSEKEVSDLVIQIDAAAKDSGNILETIQLSSQEGGGGGDESKKDEEKSPFTQTEESEKLSGAYELPLQIKISTDFYKLLDFLGFLENLSRYIDISSLNIKANETDGAMDVNIYLVSYIKP